MADQVKTSLSDEVLAQYIGTLQKELGTSVNSQALRMATGSSSDVN